MAITVLSEPGSISLSKNQIPLILQSNSFLQTAGVKASCNIGFETPIPEGEKFVFNYAGFAHEFTFIDDDVSAPTCTQVKRNNEDSYDPDDEWIINELIPQLRKNYYIEKHFNLSVSTFGPNFSLLIEAKQPGALFNFTIDAIDAIGNPSTTILPDDVILGVDQLLKPNYKLYCEVFITDETNSSFIPAGSAEANVNSDGIAEFNLQSILHPHLKAMLAEHTAANLVNAKLANRIFYYTYGEKYGIPIKFYCHNLPNEDLSTGKRVLLAGIDTEEFGRAKLANFTSNFVGNGKKFLTNSQVVYLPRAVPEVFASFLNFTGNLVNAEAVGYPASGSPVSYVSANINSPTLSTVAAKLKATFPLIFSNLNLLYAQFRFKSISSYSTGSAWFTINFIDKLFLNTKYFAFRNSFGVYEVFFATEAQNQTLKVDDIQNFERQLPLNYGSSHVQFGQMDKQFTQEFEINTGYIGVNPNQDSRTYSANLKAELLLTTEAYVYQNGAWQPIVINSNSFGIPGPQNHDFGFTLKYKFAYSSPSPTFNTFI